MYAQLHFIAFPDYCHSTVELQCAKRFPCQPGNRKNFSSILFPLSFCLPQHNLANNPFFLPLKHSTYVLHVVAAAFSKVPLRLVLTSLTDFAL